MSGVFESVLFAGYGVNVAPDPRLCACGGVIRPKGPSDEQIKRAVQAHNRTDVHRKWRLAWRP